MARQKTSWREKLAKDDGLPKVGVIDGKMSKRWGEGTFVVPAPRDVDDLMKKVGKGRLITIGELRSALAARHGATIACPITTGIFAWIAAHAAAEAADEGAVRVTPWWRTLKTGGELNPKFPGGIKEQRARLEAEGHRVVERGRKVVVEGYERRLAKLG